MSTREVRLEIVDLLRDIVPEVDPADLSGDVSFQEDLGMDSMDSLDLVDGVNERLGVEIPESDYEQIDTLEKLVSYVDDKQA